MLVNQNRLASNFIWVLVTGYLVMFMQAGFALVETGFCRAKSAMHVMMTNFMIYGIGMLGYFVCGLRPAVRRHRQDRRRQPRRA